MLKNELLFAIDANTYDSVVVVCTCNYVLYGKFDRCFDMTISSINNTHSAPELLDHESLLDQFQNFAYWPARPHFAMTPIAGIWPPSCERITLTLSWDLGTNRITETFSLIQ